MRAHVGEIDKPDATLGTLGGTCVAATKPVPSKLVPTRKPAGRCQRVKWISALHHLQFGFVSLYAVKLH